MQYIAMVTAIKLTISFIKTQIVGLRLGGSTPHIKVKTTCHCNNVNYVTLKQRQVIIHLQELYPLEIN